MPLLKDQPDEVQKANERALKVGINERNFTVLDDAVWSMKVVGVTDLSIYRMANDLTGIEPEEWTALLEELEQVRR